MHTYRNAFGVRAVCCSHSSPETFTTSNGCHLRLDVHNALSFARRTKSHLLVDFKLIPSDGCFKVTPVSFTNHAGLIWSTSITSSLPFSSLKEFESCYHHPPCPQLPLLEPIHTLYCSQLSLPLPWKWSQVAKPAQTLTIALALESYSPTNERRRALWPVLFVGQDAGFQAISQHVNDSDYAAGPVHVFHNNNGAHKVLQHSSLPFQTFYALSSVISLPFGLGENAAVHTCQNM